MNEIGPADAVWKLLEHALDRIPDVPNWVTTAVREGPSEDFQVYFDPCASKEGYIDLLRGEINLEPRGSEWTKILNRCLAVLESQPGSTLPSFHLIKGRSICFVHLSPDEQSGILWEYFGSSEVQDESKTPNDATKWSENEITPSDPSWALLERTLESINDSPEWVRALVREGPSENCHAAFDRGLVKEDYLEFLRGQIELEPRGPEWTAVLTRRLQALEPYVGSPLPRFHLSNGRSACFIRLTPDDKNVVLVEYH